jgi:cysteinyl-tRNA synthetase
MVAVLKSGNRKPMFKLFNSLTNKKEGFKPLKDKKVGLYTCGPTVYLYAHLGNLRTYIFEDILKRVLEYNGYRVKQVMNITDVGHLTSDADSGEDKMEKGARREKKTAGQIAAFYTRAFKNDLKRLNIKFPEVWVRATATIKDQIELIKILEKKGFTYQIKDGVYFDSSKLKTYGRLGGKKARQLKPGARVKLVPGKKSPRDFALWKLTPPGVKRQMEWASPWGRGFPGWHTECVVMSLKKLGLPFDIHCGGIDHIPVHHPNEIAQAEAAYGQIPARYWLHGAFLILKKGRMGKSEGNLILLNDVIKKGFNPLAFRYLCLIGHYRSPLIFSWESLRAAQNALKNLYAKTAQIKSSVAASRKARAKNYQKRFLEIINNDLDVPRTLALTWQVLGDPKLTAEEKYSLLLDFDRVFGLDLAGVKKLKMPAKIKVLIQKREQYRKKGQWQKADEIREKIRQAGWEVRDKKIGR